MLRRIFQQLQKHPGFFFALVGVNGACVYLLRLACGPHVSWDRKNNPEPWSRLDPTHQQKLVSITKDYQRLKKERDNF